MERYAEAKQRLLESKKEIISNLLAENADFQATVTDMDTADPADVAASDLDKRIIEALGAESARALDRVDAALARIDAGTYGVCAKCGQMIDPDRLEAIPEAVLCIACKSTSERQKFASHVL
ncbi:MAG: TraR/DksA family transcriptional regulator [Spirochaetia bacterium]